MIKFKNFKLKVSDYTDAVERLFRELEYDINKYINEFEIDKKDILDIKLNYTLTEGDYLYKQEICDANVSLIYYEDKE